ncbi:hypothetical protein [Candidatus Roseilinea sp. NK_OTU-006]|jgi:hypothetical protein|uniref:hypothetical protein n=1 Tax=Candidatus Roseilinea sp. NK_OTU-006 TaxID=2704250 RepID=UPI00145E0622|nr:hypothetical protein [Candidatus Roseilinea sp. NK_OTU-006]
MIRRKNRLLSVSTAVVLSLAMALQAPGVVHADISITYGTGSTTYFVHNPTSNNATFVAAYYPPVGSTPTFTSPGVALNALNTIAVDVSSIGALGANWVGSVVLSADQEILAVARTAYTGKGTSGNGYGEEMISYAAFTSGSTELYAPQIIRLSGVNLSTSRMTIQNTTGSVANVYVTVYHSGTGYSRSPITLQPYGSITLRTNIDADWPGVTLWNGNASAVVTATQPIAGFVERHWDVVSQNQNWAAGYAMPTPADAATKLYSPALFRNCVGGVCVLTVASTFNAYSSLFVQNTTGATNVITITAIRRSPFQVLTNQIVQSLPPYGAYLTNPFNNDNNPSGPLNPMYAEMGGNFLGSAIIESQAPVVGIGYIFNPPATAAQNTAGGYKLLTESGATHTIVAPRFARVCSSCNDFTNIADFTEFGNLQIMNLDSVTVTLTTIEFVRNDGTTQFTLNASNQSTYFLPGESLTLGPGRSIAINTRTGGSLDRGGGTGVTSPNLNTIFGSNFQGSVRVTAPSGAKIKAIVTMSRGAKQSDVYNAYNR